jgi:hypothetical protein
MTITSLTSMTRRTITMALSLLLFALAFMALAHPAGALQPTGPGGGGENPPPNAPPVARFTISPNPALVSSQPLAVQAHTLGITVLGGPAQQLQTGDVVTFDGSASHDDHAVVGYEWDYGTGAFATGTKIEKKRFYTAGIYEIRLRVTDAQDANGVEIETLNVRNPPHAAIAANVAVPLVGQQVTYSAAGSTGDPGIASYAWDLDGNGTFETPTGTTPTVSTSYQSAGARQVAVKVTDTDGTPATASVNEIVNQAPIAGFSDAPSPAFVGEAVHFDGSLSSDDDPIADYAWDLDGNGTFETDTHASPSATMKYTTPGTITVRLRVTDDHGVTATVTHALVVNPAPKGTTSSTNGSTTGTTTGTTTSTTGPHMSITPRTMKLNRLGNIAIRVACSKTERACTGRLSLRSVRGAHTAALGGGKFVLGSGQSKVLHVHLSRANQHLVKRLGTLKAQASALATDAAGHTATTKVKVAIKR